MWKRQAGPQQHDRLSSDTLLSREESDILEELLRERKAFVDSVQEHLLRIFDQAGAARQCARVLQSQSRQLKDQSRQLQQQKRRIYEQCKH